MENVVSVTEHVPAPIPITKMVSILIVDDDKDFRDSLSRFFKTAGYSVSVARDPDSALERLKRSAFEVVICDIKFDPGMMSGDEFLIEHRNLLKGSKTIAITGQGIDQITQLENLIELGIEVVSKGDHLTKVNNAIKEKAGEEREKIQSFLDEQAQKYLDSRRNRAITESSSDSERFRGERYLLAELRKTLVNWLRTREDPSRRGIAYGNKVYSCESLLTEIKLNTPVGRDHLEMMLDLFKDTLNLDVPDE